jgi:hypothetical protein
MAPSKLQQWWTSVKPRPKLQTRLSVATAASSIVLSTILSVLAGEIARSQLTTQIEASLAESAQQVDDKPRSGHCSRKSNEPIQPMLGSASPIIVRSSNLLE